MRQALNLLERPGDENASRPGIPVDSPAAMEAYLRDYAERHGLDFDSAMADIG
jgi:hypothetical protein